MMLIRYLTILICHYLSANYHLVTLSITASSIDCIIRFHYHYSGMTCSHVRMKHIALSSSFHPRGAFGSHWPSPLIGSRPNVLNHKRILSNRAYWRARQELSSLRIMMHSCLTSDIEISQSCIEFRPYIAHFSDSYQCFCDVISHSTSHYELQLSLILK